MLSPTTGKVVWLASGPRGQAIRLWLGTSDGAQQKQLARTNSSVAPRFSPDGTILAFSSQTSTVGTIHATEAPFDIERAIADIAGTVETLRWGSTGREIFAIVRALQPRSPWRVPSRKLISIDTQTGGIQERPTSGLTPWEIEPLGDDGLVACLVSEDSDESGWYEAFIATVGPDGGVEELYRPEWQVSSLAAEPGGGRLAFIEGWCSDRGHLAGDARILDVHEKRINRIPALEVDITTIWWRDRSSLWISGWWGHGSRRGVLNVDGTVCRLDHEDATLVVSQLNDIGVMVAVRESPSEPPEIVAGSPDTPWSRITTLNGQLHRAARRQSIHTSDLSWKAADGREITGMVVRREQAGRSQPLVVFAHGGPTTGWRKSFHVPAFILASAGYTVLLPNPRGSSGFGQEFAQANIGSPGSSDLEDIIAGVDSCVDAGVASSRVGIMGMSYGGFLSGAAATRSDRFACAIVVSSHGNFLTAWNAGTNAAFFEKLLGCRPYGLDAACRYVAQSPLIYAGAQSAPTLVIHGAGDRVTPSGRGLEFYRGLRRAGANAQLVLYPGEGHSITRLRHRCDMWRRVLAFLAIHLDGERMQQ